MPVKEKEKRDTGPTGQRARAGEFIREVRTELRKVVWPTRQEATNLTLIVIGVSTAVGVFLGGVDAVFTSLYQLILR